MKPIFNIPQCDDALLIVNKRALFLMQQGGTITFPQTIHPINVNDQKFVRWLLRFAHKRLNGTKDYQILSDSFVTKGQQFEYLYRAVPCGCCELCTHHKRISLMNRCKAESECYEVPPFFFTLTYNREHVPADYNLCYRDVQLFFKRFRKLLTKKGLPTNFRYLVAGEYGTKSRTHRPHYHVIMWNNPYGASYYNYDKWDELCKDLWKSWQKDDWQVFSRKDNFSVCGDGVAGYVAKYVGKPVSYGRRVKPFIHMSTGNGGIGSPFYKDFLKHYHQTYDSKLTYLSTVSGQIVETTFGSYLRQLFHPSPSRLLSPKVKMLYRDITERYVRYVRLGLPWSIAYDQLENLRPCKTVQQHLLPSVDEVAEDPIRLKWLMTKELSQMQAYVDSLSDQPEVTDDTIEDYYRYIAHAVTEAEDHRGSLAGRKSRLREQAKIMESKQSL